MSSKRTSDEDGKSDTDDLRTRAVKTSTSEEKEVTGRRPRRPRVDYDNPRSEAKGGGERPYIRTIEGGWELDAGPTDHQKDPADGAVEGQHPKRSDGSSRHHHHFDNDETEVLAIPDLEENAEEENIARVAVAPKNTSRRLPSLHELDDDLQCSVASATDGLDMTLLTKTLVPPEMLEEDDSVWEFDGLLQAVTQEFNAQMRGASSEPHRAKKRTVDRGGGGSGVGGSGSGSVGSGDEDGYDDNGRRAAPFDEGGAMLSRSRTARALLA